MSNDRIKDKSNQTFNSKLKMFVNNLMWCPLNLNVILYETIVTPEIYKKIPTFQLRQIFNATIIVNNL